VAKFKKGDRVRLVTGIDHGGPEAGAVGTVVEDSFCPYVDWDGYRKGHDATFDDGRQSVLSANESDLEPIEAAAPPADHRLIAILIAAGHVTQAQVDAARALLAMEA